MSRIIRVQKRPRHVHDGAFIPPFIQIGLKGLEMIHQTPQFVATTWVPKLL